MKNWHKDFENKSQQEWLEKVKRTLFTKNSSAGSPHLHYLLVEYFGWKEKCSICGIEEWNGKKMTMNLDHIDGKVSNCEFGNLRFICPNCDRQLETNCGKNINNGKKKVSDIKLLQALKEEKTIRQALFKCGLSPRGMNYVRARELLAKENIK
jgi:hypothetical protein